MFRAGLEGTGPVGRMMKRAFFLLGVDFRDCSRAVRDAVRVGADELPALLAALRTGVPGVEELVLLSTCNRTEIYAAGDRASATLLAECFAVERRIDDPIPWVHLDGQAAAKHLFRVACGLESAILGDAQIAGQVRAAHLAACAAGTSGSDLHRVFQAALQVSGRVRRATGLARGEAGLGAAVTSVVRDLGPIRSALIIGAGDAARDVCLHLTKRLGIPLRIANRSAERAEELASSCGAEVVAWRDVQAVVADVDLVVAATSALVPLLTTSALEEAGRFRARPLAIIDVGVPRNTEPAPGVVRIDLDAIVVRQEKALAGRQSALPAAEERVAEEVRKWASFDEVRAREEAIKLLFLEADGACEALLGERVADEVGGAVERIRSRLAGVLGRHACRLRGQRPRTARKEIAG